MGTSTSPYMVRLIMLMVLAVTAKGLEFSLSHTASTLPGLRSPCGVLLCKESKQDSADADNPRQITNMTVFKSVTPRQGNLGISEALRLTSLATLTSTQPTVDQVYDGMKLSGLLENGQASLRIELSKQTDCLAEYTCELTAVNAHGERVITSHRLLQRPEQSIPNMQYSGLTSMLFMKQLSMAEEQNVKLAMIAKSVERLESNFHSIDSKVCLLDSKLSAIDSDAIQEKVLSTIKTQIDEHFSKVLNASQKTNDTLCRTAALLTSLNSQNTEFQNNVMDSYQDLFGNVTRGMDEMFTRNKNLTDTLKNNFVSFREDVELNWREFESTTNTSSTKTLTALKEMALNFNASLGSIIKSAAKDLFQPETCEKGKPVLLHHSSTPYPVVSRSDIVGLDGPILCDTTTDQGGWIIIQRRSTGNVEFYRDWASYRDGFGDYSDDFWLGNEKIHRITSSGRYELRVELKYQDKSAYAVYDRISLSGEDDSYALTLGSYSGTAGDSLDYHRDMKFSTFDRDNDQSHGNCAQDWLGAWWYKSCFHSNINAKWRQAGSQSARWNGFTNNASFTEMKIRRVKFALI